MPLPRMRPPAPAHETDGIFTLGLILNSGIRTAACGGDTTQLGDAQIHKYPNTHTPNVLADFPLTCPQIPNGFTSPGDPQTREYYCGSTGPAPYVGLAAKQLVNLPFFNLFMCKWTGCIEVRACVRARAHDSIRSTCVYGVRFRETGHPDDHTASECGQKPHVAQNETKRVFWIDTRRVSRAGHVPTGC